MLPLHQIWQNHNVYINVLTFHNDQTLPKIGIILFTFS